jgi:hypothetical protein
MCYDAYIKDGKTMNKYEARINVKGGSFLVSVEAQNEYAARRLIEAMYEGAVITSIRKVD